MTVVLYAISCSVAVIGGLGTLAGVLVRLDRRITTLEGTTSQHEKELVRQGTVVDVMVGSVNEIKVQNAHILERIESLFALIKQGSKI